jgi:transcriptional regulator with XRE-family HTH domain
MDTTNKPKHIGRNISRIRELRNMKQEALAQALGVSQQTVSNIENSEEVEEKTLAKVADALGVSAEAIKHFSEENVITYFNNFYDSQGSFGSFATNQNQCTFNPIDKFVEVFEENKKLYERLLDAEKEKNTYLEKLLDK